jgi:hypothetical protein
MIQTMTRLLVGALALLSLMACTTQPQPPLMSPLAEARIYGYTDNLIRPGLYKVSYTSPPIGTSSSRSGREKDTEIAKSQAYDLALWRAAQLALQDNYEGFRIDNTDDEVEVTVHEGYYPSYRPYFYPYRPYYPGPYYGSFGYPSYSSYRYTTVQAITTLIVALRKTVGVGDFNAAETAKRLARKYPNALPSSQPSSTGQDASS